MTIRRNFLTAITPQWIFSKSIENWLTVTNRHHPSPEWRVVTIRPDRDDPPKWSPLSITKPWIISKSLTNWQKGTSRHHPSRIEDGLTTRYGSSILDKPQPNRHHKTTLFVQIEFSILLLCYCKIISLGSLTPKVIQDQENEQVHCKDVYYNPLIFNSVFTTLWALTCQVVITGSLQSTKFFLSMRAWSSNNNMTNKFSLYFHRELLFIYLF